MAKVLLRIVTMTIAVVGLLLVLAAVAMRQPTLGTAGSRALSKADRDRLEQDVRFLAHALPTRDSSDPVSLRRAAVYIEQAFAPTGARLKRQEYSIGDSEFRNVLASYGPEAGARWVVGAHYDSFGGYGDNPGADDNASGAAALLELGRLLGSQAPSMRVDLAAYSTEEPPYFGSNQMGSAVHAASLQVENAALAGMIALEMIGYFSETQPWPHPLLRLLYPDRGDFVAVVGRWRDRRLCRWLKRPFRAGSSVPIYSFNAPGTGASDHVSFWAQGYSAVMLTDTASIRNPHYHAPGDRADTLDYDRLAGVVDGLFEALLHADES